MNLICYCIYAPDIGQYIVLSGLSTFDFSACGVSIGIQNEGNGPLVETPPDLPVVVCSAVTLSGVDEGVDDGVDLMGVIEFAAFLSASVRDPVSFL